MPTFHRRSFQRAAIGVFVAFATCNMAFRTVAAAEPKNSGVSVSINFGDGAQYEYSQLPWSDKMTVLDALAAAAKHRRGVPYKVRGTGTIAFVMEIAEQPNEGADARNWIFRVNGKLGKVGAGTQKLAAGDQVEWRFARLEDLQQ